MKFNYNKLQAQIEAATKDFFTNICKKNPNEEIYSVALFSDDDGITMCPAVNSINNYKTRSSNDKSNDKEFYKFDITEWEYESDETDHAFVDISKSLYTMVSKMWEEENDDDLDEHLSKLTETAISALEKLSMEGFFTTTANCDEVFVTYAPSLDNNWLEGEDGFEMIDTLNDNNKLAKEYKKWVKSW